MSKILVAMSGGVDSSVAVRLLLEEGHSVSGVTFVTDTSEGSVKASRDAASCADSYGISHETVDISEEFRREVKDYFVRSYEAGETPNPCVVCNRQIKFGLLGDYAAERGFDLIATGHYARLTHEDGRVHLRRAADPAKDQTYMLAHVPEIRLATARFPLGDYTKDEIRALAADSGLDVANKKDSQDICFIPDGDYVRFLTEFRGREPLAGDYISEAGELLGRHRGQECYTVGQGKGLGIALGRRVFVLHRDAGSNRVTLGDSYGLMKNEITLRDVNFIGRDFVRDGEELTAKIRYAHRGAVAKVFNINCGKLRLHFDEPQRAPAPGQLCVLYDGDEAVGGGFIE